jgi:transposase-like protein
MGANKVEIYGLLAAGKEPVGRVPSGQQSERRRTPLPPLFQEVFNMVQRAQYTEAFRQQALAKVYSRGSRSVKSIAEELNINPWTLKNWMKSRKDPSVAHGSVEKRPGDWSASERLEALMHTHAMDDAALAAWCRERGLFPHHLKQWRMQFESGRTTADTHASELRELKRSVQALERDLGRKEKALAEAAALLVLQKKYQALWEEKDA